MNTLRAGSLRGLPAHKLKGIYMLNLIAFLLAVIAVELYLIIDIAQHIFDRMK